MSGGRYALLIATGRYDDQGLAQLRSPGQDARELAGVLRDPGIGDFEVSTLVDRPHHHVTRAVEEFFRERRLDDLLLLHLSGHGVKNDNGDLYFAATDTDRRLLASTAVSAEFLRTQMAGCRARSIVLLLDCCYSGAFLPGGKGDTTVHIKDELAGHGRVVLTATNRTEYAWEGDRLDELDPQPSRFTGAIVKGLSSGEADRDGDGLISAHDLYDYVYEELLAAQVRQHPLMSAQVEHRVVIARSVATPAVPDTGLPDPEPTDSKRTEPEPPSGPDPLTRLASLTEALTELPCMEDAQGRVQFALLLGEHLRRTVDVRGVRLREDAMVLARAALNQDRGLPTLLSVAEIFEGPQAREEIERFLKSGERPGETRTPFHGRRRDGARPHGTELLLPLTTALCELSCMDDVQGRAIFASVLGEHLGRQVDVRGRRLREDVVTLVRSALGVPDGDRVLVALTGIVEGPRAAEEVQSLIDRFG